MSAHYHAEPAGFYGFFLGDFLPNLYSRKIAGWGIHATDSADRAAHRIRRTALAEAIHCEKLKPFLHGDNGATVMLHWLGIKPSYSHPRVCDDNAYTEALYRTAKYRPEFHTAGFQRLISDPDYKLSRFFHRLDLGQWRRERIVFTEIPLGHNIEDCFMHPEIVGGPAVYFP